MDNATLAVDPERVDGVSTRLRLSSVLVTLALVFALFVVVQQRADAAPAASGSVASVAAAAAAPAAIAPQIDVAALIRSIVCPILNQLAAAFSGSPFSGFVLPIIRQLQVAFGCIVISPGG